MILGASTSEKLRLLTASSGTPAISWKVDYLTVSAASPPVVQLADSDYNAAQIATSTTTDIKVGDATNKTRILAVTFKNESASVTCDLTPIQTDGSNPVSGPKATLLPLETLIYNGSVWIHQDANGATYSQSLKLDAKKFVASDIAYVTANSLADVTGLTVPLIAGRKYGFDCRLYHISNATTTGAQFGVNIGAAPTLLIMGEDDTILASTSADTTASGTSSTLNSPVIAEGTGAATLVTAKLNGFIIPSADGTFAIRASSEVSVAAGLTIKAGSWLRIWEMD